MAGVEVRGLEVTYRGVDREVRALGGLDLSIADGEPVAIIGPSGCGKSTLLLAAAGLLTRDAGTVRVGGEPVEGVRLRTSLILQDFGLLPWKNVFHNAALGLEVRGVPAADVREQTFRALEAMGIADFARAYPGELSGGMRQRLAVARAQAFWHVVVPASLPKIFTALRISTGTAIAVLFFSETIAGTDGLGYLIVDAWGRIQYSEMFAGILAMALLGVVLYEVLDVAESRICRWTRVGS